MAVTDVFWFKHDGYDVHVVRGGPPSSSLLDDLVLEIDQTDLVLGTDAPAGVLIRFRVNFAGDPNMHRVAVDSATGSVTAMRDPPPGPQLRSFVMTALIRDVGADADFQVRIRVHIHRAVQAIGLTPAILSIRQGTVVADGFHFGVLARFDDGTTGEVYGWPGLIWTSADPQKVEVGPSGLGVSVAGDDLVGISLTLDPTLYPAPRPPAANGQVRRIPSFVTVAATIPVRPVVAGRGAAKAVAVDRAANILFLPEGFPPQERSQFESIVSSIVYNLRTMRTVTPLSILGDSINYWQAFVPFQHQSPGLTVLSECLVFPTRSGSLGGAEVDRLRPAPATAPSPGGPSAMSLHNLVFEVGLPVPADDAPPGGPVGAAVKRERWTQIYGTDSSGAAFTADRVPDTLYATWLKLVSRALIAEVDTCFGLVLGGRPRLERDALLKTDGMDAEREAQSLYFHPHRSRRPLFEQFLNNLRVGRTSSDAVGSGAIWVSGKDRGLVCFIVRSKRGRARFDSQDGNLFLPIDEADAYPVRQSGDQVELVPGEPLVGGRRLVNALTFAHEVSHAFGLGDEYGERDSLPADEEEAVNASISAEGNVQLRRALQPSGGPRLDATCVRQLLRWNWPRVRAAGVLARRPEPAGTNLIVGNELTLTLLPGHGRRFHDGDVVFLRRRPLAQQTHLIPWLRIVAPPAGDRLRARVILAILDPDPVISDRFVGEAEVSGEDQASALFAAVPRSGSPIDPNTGVPRFLPLVAPTVLEHMAISGGPLDVPAVNPTIACDPIDQRRRAGRGPLVIPTNLPAGLLDQLPDRIAGHLRRKQFLIVGLYQGGRRFHCGVFHPAGGCLMRDNHRKHRFCQVCQYLLVDRIDPTRHGVIDAVYGRDLYPEPQP